MSLDGHFTRPKEPLILLEEPLSYDNMNKCCHCGKQCKGFIYYWPDSECEFVLDVLCAVPIGTIKVMHRSHEHELVPITAKVSVPCCACELDHEGLPHLCTMRNFWIHWECALLPNKIKLKEHHSDQHILILTDSYSPTLTIKTPRIYKKCELRKRKITCLGSHICTRCDYAAHIKCAASDPQSFSTASIEDSGLTHLPIVDEQTSLVRYLLENTKSSKITEKEEDDPIHAEKLFKGKHEHPLIYHDHTSIYIKDEEEHKYRSRQFCSL